MVVDTTAQSILQSMWIYCYYGAGCCADRGDDLMRFREMKRRALENYSVDGQTGTCLDF